MKPIYIDKNIIKYKTFLDQIVWSRHFCDFTQNNEVFSTAAFFGAFFKNCLTITCSLNIAHK